MSDSTNDILHMKFSEFYLCFHNPREIGIYFLGLLWEIVLGVITDNYDIYSPWKNVKKNAILFKLFWYKVLVTEIEITQFPDGFRRNHFIF